MKYSKYQLHHILYKQYLLDVYIFDHEERQRKIGDRGPPFIDKRGPISFAKKIQPLANIPHDP